MSKAKAKPATPADAVPTDTCGTCRFFGADDPPDSTGRRPCRRYPSAEMKLPSQWCGEFKENADTVAKAAPAASSVSPADQGAR